MGMGKTIYKGEVKTGVFAWFSCGQRLIASIPCGSGLAREEGLSVGIGVA
jgi:hypothetical protein